jgi:hypothetical protein
MAIGNYRLSRQAAEAEARRNGVDAIGSTETIVGSADGLNDAGGLTVLNLLGPSNRGAPMGEARALSLPAIMRALEVLCGLFAMTPMVYYRREGEGRSALTMRPRLSCSGPAPTTFRAPFC